MPAKSTQNAAASVARPLPVGPIPVAPPVYTVYDDKSRLADVSIQFRRYEPWLNRTAASQPHRLHMQTFKALLLVAAALLAACGSEARVAAFEFCDDFIKPWDAQRDPWDERIETERHDFTQSAITVGRGVVQIESGYTYFYKEDAGEAESSHALPETLLRFGLTEDIEFRVRSNYVWQFIEDAPDRAGAEDLRYSLKLQLTRTPVGDWLPTSALELRGTAPTGGQEFTTDRVEFSADYIYQWTPAEGVTVAGSTGFGTNGFADFALMPEEPAADRFQAFSQSAVIGFELSESNTMYVEWYGIFSDGREDEFVVSVLNMGIDHYVTNDFVVDVRAGVGLSRDSDDFFVGVGGGYRF